MLRTLIGMLSVCLVLMIAAGSDAASPAPQPKELPVRMPTIPLPQTLDGRVIREFKQGDHTVRLDLERQVLQLYLPKEVDWRQKGQFSVGDLIQVKQNSSLRRQTTTLATVRAGQQLTVSTVHADGKWLEAGVVAGGQLVRGWLPVADVEFLASESVLQPALKPSTWDEFTSAAVLAQKAKQFDDGLMAAVQLAAQSGHGQFVGKATFLKQFANRLADDKSGNVLMAACLLGKVPAQISPANRQAVDLIVADFLSTEYRSKPIGFYTWNDQLSSVFQQDRMLQTDLTLDKSIDVVAIAKAFQGDAAGRKAYEGWLDLQAKLTNPQVNPDLRPLLSALDAGQTPDVQPGTRIFPPSYSQEIDLLKRMFPDGMVPADFQVMEELIKRIKAGKLDLTPRPDSGWYDRQLWSLEPYVRPHQMPEGGRWSANDEYHEHLTKLFKGMWALARETHIKDLEVFPPAPAAERGPEPEPKIQVTVQAQLSAEPVATSYYRRAVGYRFVRELLTEQFGDGALKQLHRLTAAGPVATNLDDELRQMEALFHGAAVTVSRQLGLAEQRDANVGSGAGSEADAQAFLAWGVNLHRDPDLTTDARMMVPLYFDREQKKTKVWAFLGWTTQRVSVYFNKTPAITVTDKAGKAIDPKRLEVNYAGNSYEIATPVFQELFVSKLLNRNEFRKHCDAYGSTAAIVKNLE